jgi:hypothetical protein
LGKGACTIPAREPTMSRTRVLPTPLSPGPGHVVSYELMASTGLKQKMVETVEHLPDSATVEDAIERLYFLAKVERGLEQSAAGDTIAHEDVKKRFLG